MNKKFIFVFLFLIFISANIFAYLPKADMKIFAVNSQGRGMDANLIIEIKPGTGKIYSNINSQVGVLTQESERNAVIAAERIVPNAKGKYDYFFEIQSVASLIDGPSAGAAMALLIVSMLNDKDLSGKVSITGTITEDGFVGDVGGIGSKAKKASEIGIKLFMIPARSRRQAITNASGNAQIVDLPDFAYNNWNMKVVEVETIEDIKNYVSMNIEEIDINKTKETTTPDYLPPGIEYSDALLPMRNIVDDYIVNANSILTRTENSISNSKIKDSSIVQSLLSLVDYSKESISQAEKYSKANYLYTAANEAFLAKTYLITIDEVVNNPSILSSDSTIYNMRIKNIENKIATTENRSKLCSLDKMEWCISARQRIVWAKNKIKDIKSSSSNSNSQLDKIMNYSYSLAWVNIANDFLDAGISNNSPAFVESSEFKELAQQYIVDIENEIVLVDASIAQNADLQRRLEAAKTDYEMGWYVTALYDAASAKAILKSRKETSQEAFDENHFIVKYNTMSFLTTPQNKNSLTNIWSKMYFDHSTFYYKSHQHYKSKNTTKATNAIKTANSVINLSTELFNIETKVHEYYNNAGNIVIEIKDKEIKPDSETNIPKTTTTQTTDKVYVYAKGDSKNTTILYVIAIGLFLMIVAIIVDNEIRRNNKQAKIQKALLELEHKLSDGHISKFTYDDMKKSYLKELKDKKQEMSQKLESKKEAVEIKLPQKTSVTKKKK